MIAGREKQTRKNTAISRFELTPARFEITLFSVPLVRESIEQHETRSCLLAILCRTRGITQRQERVHGGDDAEALIVE
jgi:hypothetical protein